MNENIITISATDFSLIVVWGIIGYICWLVFAYKYYSLKGE